MAFENEEDFGGNDCSAYSLDGRSLIVPDYGDIDDMSSLGGNSKLTYRGDDGAVRYIGNMKIVDKKKVTERSPSKMSSLEKKLASYQGDPENQDVDYGVDIYDNSLSNRKDVDLSQSFEEKDEKGKEKKCRCVPQWISEAPLWLKFIIIISVALLIGAVVLIVVGAKLSSLNLISSSTEVESPIDGNDSLEDSTLDSESISATFYPDRNVVATSSPSITPFSNDFNATVPTIETTLPPTEATLNVETDKPSSAPSVSSQKGKEKESDAVSTTPPTETVTNSPTNSPTLSPTGTPTVSPTYSPTTAEPSMAPSDAPSTSVPSSSPSTTAPSSSPTASPTSTPSLSPTQVPTQSPTISMINLFVMGGRFDGEDSESLVSGLQTLPSFDENTILVHLGDFNSPYTTSCLEDSYISNVDSYQQSSVPVYFVPGDNEYNDCPNPSEALGFWNQYFLNFESKYWEDPSWEVLRQFPNYGENFAFLQRDILFVGINLVGGIIHDENEWSSRHEANLLWIDTTAAKYDGLYNTMVVFAHSDPQIEINQNFFNAFYPMVERYSEQVIFVHRNLGIDTWKRESQYMGISNLEVVAVEGSKWPPMWMQIDPQTGSFNIDQSSWYDEYMSKGKLPKNP